MSPNWIIKGLAHSEIKILLLYAHPCVVPKPFDFLSSTELRRRTSEDYFPWSQGSKRMQKKCIMTHSLFQIIQIHTIYLCVTD